MFFLSWNIEGSQCINFFSFFYKLRWMHLILWILTIFHIFLYIFYQFHTRTHLTSRIIQFSTYFFTFLNKRNVFDFHSINFPHFLYFLLPISDKNTFEYQNSNNFSAHFQVILNNFSLAFVVQNTITVFPQFSLNNLSSMDEYT